jgi:hypothetical protein
MPTDQIEEGQTTQCQKIKQWSTRHHKEPQRLDTNPTKNMG